MTEDRYAEWDAAYVLGALDSAERLEYEGHLAECGDCSERVRELAGMPGVLARLDPAAAEALRDLPAEPLGEETSPSAVAHVARRVRRRRRVAVLAGAVAVVAAAFGGAAVSTAIPPAGAVDARLAPVHGSAVSAQLTAMAVPWGTKLAWSCSYPAAAGRYATDYRLVVTTADGGTTVATWEAHGDGAAGLAAATSIPRAAIRAVEITTPAGAVVARGSLSG